MTATADAKPDRRALRTRLKAGRAAWLASPDAADAPAALAARLAGVLDRLEPLCLGLYWPMEGEFNAVQALLGHAWDETPQWALPYCRKSPRQMDYRRWDGTPPGGVDEVGIQAPTGAVVVPDVVLAPCVGFSRAGYRLGYGGGYFDRWLAAHPGVTAVGVAWSRDQLDEAEFPHEAHDQPLSLIVTERDILAP